MLTRLIAGFIVMAVCVVVHAAGVMAALGRLRAWAARAHGFWETMEILILLAIWVVLLHLVEISAWAALYTWKGAVPDFGSALYFSAVTYTTTGYGDIVLAAPWRIDGSMEALTGILMCGWSTGFFFAIVSRVYLPTESR